MEGRGAVISDDDADTLVQYLATNFGPDSKSAPPSSDKTALPADSNTATHTAASDVSAPVNVNKANADELTSALGLTHAEAELIVGHREQYGNFKTWQDIADISGVPADKIKENQKRLVF
jgi:competence ComEA-like helix-hairpin-helix protein